jgi:type III secretory pathway lipoprotein EscJ
MGNSTLKTLMKPENEAEANVIKSVLEENGIYAEIKSFHDTAYDGLFQSQYGWGLIRVAERDLAEAQRIIEEWRNAAPEELPWNIKSTD